MYKYYKRVCVFDLFLGSVCVLCGGVKFACRFVIAFLGLCVA
jgi:hypothetical protein